MKPLIWLISSVNVYFGVNCALNALHILQETDLKSI